MQGRNTVGSYGGKGWHTNLLRSGKGFFTVRCVVTKPLAIVFYERLLPGSRIGHQLTVLGWRVAEVKRASDLAAQVRAQKPVVVVAELALRVGDLCAVIVEMKQDPEISHVPVLGYADPANSKLAEAAVKAGVGLVAAEAGILDQFPELLDHVLAVE